MNKGVASLSRREILRHAAVALGVGAISPGIASAVMAATQVSPGTKPRILTVEQMDLVAVLTEMILPATDTPGANGAGVHHYIDALLGDCFTPAHRDSFMKGLADVDVRAKARGFQSFLAADTEARHQLAVEMDKEAYAEPTQSGAPFFRELKELTLVGYYTSKVGATMELAYDPIPGAYKGCIPYKTLGRAWSGY